MLTPPRAESGVPPLSPQGATRPETCNAPTQDRQPLAGAQGLSGGIAMFCRGCEALSRDGASRRRVSPPVWGAERISGLRCVSCRALLDADDIEQLLLEEESQLAQLSLV